MIGPASMFSKMVLDFLLVTILAFLFSWVFRKMKLPSILGALIAGLILGPSITGIINVSENPYLYQWLFFLGTIGGFILVFLVGLESTFSDIRIIKSGAGLIGLSGFVISFLGLFLFCTAFGLPVIKGLIISSALAISYSIPGLISIVAMKKIGTKPARIFGSASLVDDVVGLAVVFLVLTVFPSGKLDVLGFLYFFVLLGAFVAFSYLTVPRITHWVYHNFEYPSQQTTTMITFAFILIAALLSEWFLYEAGFGVYLLGLAFSRIHPVYKYEIKRVFLGLGDTLFFPLFFAWIGIWADLHALFSSQFWALFFVILFVLALLVKFVGAYLGSSITGLSAKDSFAVSMALLPRGGVTLVIASIGLTNALIGLPVFASIVGVAMATMILAPIFIRFGFSHVEG